MHGPAELHEGDKEAAEMNLLAVQWAGRGAVPWDFGQITSKEQASVPQEKSNRL